MASGVLLGVLLHGLQVQQRAAAKQNSGVSLTRREMTVISFRLLPRSRTLFWRCCFPPRHSFSFSPSFWSDGSRQQIAEKNIVFFWACTALNNSGSADTAWASVSALWKKKRKEKKCNKFMNFTLKTLCELASSRYTLYRRGRYNSKHRQKTTHIYPLNSQSGQALSHSLWVTVILPAVHSGC